MIQDERALDSLKILAFAMPFVGVASCFNGYFYGIRKVIKSVSSDIIENLTMMGVISSLLIIYGHNDIRLTTSILSFGILISILVSTIYSVILYIFDSSNKNIPTSKVSFLSVASVSFPIGCSSYIQMGLKTLEDILGDLSDEDLIVLDEKVADYLQENGIKNDEVNEIGNICEDILDLLSEV